jgi:hypothetical protein
MHAHVSSNPTRATIELMRGGSTIVLHVNPADAVIYIAEGATF